MNLDSPTTLQEAMPVEAAIDLRLKERSTMPDKI